MLLISKLFVSLSVAKLARFTFFPTFSHRIVSVLGSSQLYRKEIVLSVFVSAFSSSEQASSVLLNCFVVLRS